MENISKKDIENIVNEAVKQLRSIIKIYVSVYKIRWDVDIDHICQIRSMTLNCAEVTIYGKALMNVFHQRCGQNEDYCVKYTKQVIFDVVTDEWHKCAAKLYGSNLNYNDIRNNIIKDNKEKYIRDMVQKFSGSGENYFQFYSERSRKLVDEIAEMSNKYANLEYAKKDAAVIEDALSFYLKCSKKSGISTNSYEMGKLINIIDQAMSIVETDLSVNSIKILSYMIYQSGNDNCISIPGIEFRLNASNSAIYDINISVDIFARPIYETLSGGEISIETLSDLIRVNIKDTLKKIIKLPIKPPMEKGINVIKKFKI